MRGSGSVLVIAEGGNVSASRVLEWFSFCEISYVVDVLQAELTHNEDGRIVGKFELAPL